MAILDAVQSVLTAIGNWFVELLPLITQIFWTTTDGGEVQFTVIGIFTLIGTAVSFVLLVLNIIKRFTRWR